LHIGITGKHHRICLHPLQGGVIGTEYLPKDLQAGRNGAPDKPLSEAEGNEAETIRAVLDRCLNNRDESARALSMSRATLWRTMKKHLIMSA